MGIRLIISPAKKMNVVEGPPWANNRPALLDDALRLAFRLSELDYSQCKELWRCSDKLAQLNFERTRTLEADMSNDPDLLTPAILAYEGIQYQHMAPQVMSTDELEWLQGHLRIVSGLYGLLRPLDGVVPYRLEMQAKLEMGDGARKTSNLYDYWDGRIARELTGEKDRDVVVNLASVEYAKAVLPHLSAAGTPIVTCLFGSIRKSDGKLIQRATEAKAARGTMVRWCAERCVESPNELREFSERNYRLDEDRSSANTLVFIQR